jgi:hypothetical protein
MSAPVTRAELRSELGELETRVDAKLVGLETRIDAKLVGLETGVDAKLASLEARVETKFDLWGGALLDRIAASEHRLSMQVAQQILASEQRLSVEMARHANAISENLTVRVAAVDEKYADLPVRVARVEAIVDK